jgi:glycosyltransferase involved in cell wall biosynthesis
VRVLFVTQFFPPETSAGANRAGAIATALHERFALRVATLEPGYPDPAHFAPGDGADSDAGRGFEVGRGPTFPPHGASLVARALREIGMSVRLVAGAGGPRPDLVLVSTPSMFLGPVAWWEARLRGARFAWDVRDLTWVYARESTAKGGAARAVLGLLERVMLWHLRRADLVIAATDGLARVLARQGVPEPRLVTLTNGVSREILDTFAGDPPHVPTPRPRVTYVGLMGYNHGIGVLLDAAERLPHADFVLVGDGPERETLEARLANGGPVNVKLLPYETDRAALVRRYRESDVLVNHVKSTPTLDDIVYPAKTFEYFATKRPVVHAGAGYAADQLRAQDLALVVPPDDPTALARGIEAVIAAPEAARERAQRAREFVEREHCREDQLTEFLGELESRFGRDTK